MSNCTALGRQTRTPEGETALKVTCKVCVAKVLNLVSSRVKFEAGVFLVVAMDGHISIADDDVQFFWFVVTNVQFDLKQTQKLNYTLWQYKFYI